MQFLSGSTFAYISFKPSEYFTANSGLNRTVNLLFQKYRSILDLVLKQYITVVCVKITLQLGNELNEILLGLFTFAIFKKQWNLFSSSIWYLHVGKSWKLPTMQRI